jgi:3-oxoacyl-[acyl-carrier-protein] synthase II
MGHLVGGAGAVEGLIALLSVRDGIIPATLNLEDKDPKVDLDVVAGEPRKMELTAAVNNSFGFGGHNASLLFTK